MNPWLRDRLPITVIKDIINAFLRVLKSYIFLLQLISILQKRKEKVVKLMLISLFKPV